MSERILPGDNFSFDLEDGRFLNVNFTHEGIIMDVFRKAEHMAEGSELPTATEDDHLGTAGMMYDEWADWVCVPMNLYKEKKAERAERERV